MRAYKNSANQSQKMLASTVQFSTYDQTPITRPHQTREIPSGTTAVCISYRQVPRGVCWVWWGRVAGVWSYVENCTVDASIFRLL